MSEAEFRSAFESALKAAGYRLVRIDPTATNGLDEWPDTIVVGRGGRVCFIEFKARGKKPRAGQKKVLDTLASMGHTAIVVDRLEQFAAVVESMRSKA